MEEWGEGKGVGGGVETGVGGQGVLLPAARAFPAKFQLLPSARAQEQTVCRPFLSGHRRGHRRGHGRRDRKEQKPEHGAAGAGSSCEAPLPAASERSGCWRSKGCISESTPCLHFCASLCTA